MYVKLILINIFIFFLNFLHKKNLIEHNNNIRLILVERRVILGLTYMAFYYSSKGVLRLLRGPNMPAIRIYYLYASCISYFSSFFLDYINIRLNYR